MNPRNSLRRRIAVAYLLFALGSCVFFALIAVIAVEGIEVHLVDNRLAEVAAWASPRHAGDLPVTMPAGLVFHHGDAIPLSLRNLEKGVSEIDVDGIGLHVLTGKDERGNYVVVDHNSDYEKIELVVYSMFICAFLGFLLFSLFLGRFIASRVVTPITTLAGAVHDRGAQLQLLARDDELGVLARAFAAHTDELRGFLDRERFFTGDVSHELRTPLTVITGAAEILLEHSAGNPAVAAPAERILRAANEAAACVNLLLTLARSPERSDYAAINIAALAQAETERGQAVVAGRPLRLRYAGGEDFCAAAPAGLCAAAIGNLIRNACQYTEEGEVVVRLGPRSIIVEDTGPGLPAAVKAALESGAGAPPSTGSAGTGLGLVLVKRVCEHLGAALVIGTHGGNGGKGGSVIEIRFPAAAAAG